MKRTWAVASSVFVTVVALGVLWAVAQSGGATDQDASVSAWAAEDSDGLRPVVLDFIESTESGTLDVAVAWLSDDPIEQALADAQDRGVEVNVLVRDANSNVDDCRQDYGDEIDSVSHMSQLHDKFAVAGDRVLTGSVNWTDSSISEPNNLVTIESATIADFYRERFTELLEDSKTDPGCPD